MKSGIGHSTLDGEHVERCPALPPMRTARSRATMPPLIGPAPNAALPHSNTNLHGVADRKSGICLNMRYRMLIRTAACGVAVVWR